MLGNVSGTYVLFFENERKNRCWKYLLNIWGMMKHRPEGFFEKNG